MASKKYLIEYFTQDELAYANRKRYKTFEYVATSSEYQYAVKLGDGASTSVKTAIDNLCNYVRISLYDENNTLQFSTRWYVTSYIYHNGGQIEMFLQRDVIGENGLDGFFGKVERGYTETFLRNRKELSLNQRLIKRTALISNENKYGNYTINTHENEKWGILYFSKPTEIDTSTGTTTVAANPTINVPAFSPDYATYDFIDNNTDYITSINNLYPFSVWLYVKVNSSKVYKATLEFNFNQNTNSWDYIPISVNNYNEKLIQEDRDDYYQFTATQDTSTEDKAKVVLTRILNYFMYNIHEENFNTFDLPYISDDIPDSDYNNAVIKKEIEGVQKAIRYTVTKTNIYYSEFTSSQLTPKFLAANWDYVFNFTTYNVTISEVGAGYKSGVNGSAQANNYYVNENYTYVILSPEQEGNLTLSYLESFVDEPYVIYAFPLFNVTITRDAYTKPDGTNIPAYNKTIVREDAFKVFNSVIQACSGENAYLVDAQIYPYCPELLSIASSINDYPFFNIQSTAFTRKINVDLNAYLDVKKEYIKRDYYLVSPEQSANSHFNFYDYTNNIKLETEDNTYNHQKLEIAIKTALKPMNIIASAVITPQENSLKGITYDSDLRGCQPTSNGFEVSLATDKFQEYIRNNSNYQAIFGLQKEELQRQHRVERVNETTSAVVNTLTATMMGAIGGGALADYSYFGTSAKGAGAAIGAAAAGTTVGTAMGIQKTQNDKLREYEEYLQQQNFDLQIGTIKNIPNTVSRISSFNEIIMQDFYFVIETYECSIEEGTLVDTFIEKYGYGLGVFGKYEDFERDKWFLRGTLVSSNLLPIQHNIAQKEIMGGIYYYE